MSLLSPSLFVLLCLFICGRCDVTLDTVVTLSSSGQTDEYSHDDEELSCGADVELSLLQVELPLISNATASTPSAARATGFLTDRRHLLVHEFSGLLCLGAALLCLLVFNITQGNAEEKDGMEGATRFIGFDVAKLVLLFLVAFKHLWSSSWVTLGFSPPDYSTPIEVYYLPYMMPAFTFLSGIFGAGMTYKSISTMLCYTVCVNCFLFLICLHPLVGGATAWYLWALVIWRLVVSPVFFVCNAYRIPAYLPLVLILIASYFVTRFAFPLGNCWHALLGGPTPLLECLHSNSNWLSKGFVTPNFTKVDNVGYYAPYFAAGLLRSPKDWHETLRKGWACFFSICYLTMWYSHMHWLDAYIDLNAGPASVEKWFYHMPRIWLGITLYTREFALRFGLVLSTVCIIVAASEAMATVLPRFMLLLRGWGSRSLYAYVLHQLVFVAMGNLGGQRVIDLLQLELRLPACILFSITMIILLSSEGTKRLFHCVVEPYWIRSSLETLWNRMQEECLESTK